MTLQEMYDGLGELLKNHDGGLEVLSDWDNYHTVKFNGMSVEHWHDGEDSYVHLWDMASQCCCKKCKAKRAVA